VPPKRLQQRIGNLTQRAQRRRVCRAGDEVATGLDKREARREWFIRINGFWQGWQFGELKKFARASKDSALAENAFSHRDGVRSSQALHLLFYRGGQSFSSGLSVLREATLTRISRLSCTKARKARYHRLRPYFGSVPFGYPNSSFFKKREEYGGERNDRSNQGEHRGKQRGHRRENTNKLGKFNLNVQ